MPVLLDGLQIKIFPSQFVVLQFRLLSVEYLRKINNILFHEGSWIFKRAACPPKNLKASPGRVLIYCAHKSTCNILNWHRWCAWCLTPSNKNRIHVFYNSSDCRLIIKAAAGNMSWFFSLTLCWFAVSAIKWCLSVSAIVTTFRTRLRSCLEARSSFSFTDATMRTDWRWR